MKIKRYEPIEVVGPDGDDVAMEERPDGHWLSRADLIAAGVLVPVPDGEADGYDSWCSSTSRMALVNDVLAFNDGEEGYCTNAITGRLMEFREDDDGNWDEPAVQPVRLVRLDDVG